MNFYLMAGVGDLRSFELVTAGVLIFLAILARWSFFSLDSLPKELKCIEDNFIQLFIAMNLTDY